MRPEQEKVKADAARLKVIAKAPERIKAISEDALKYLQERTFPQGFKAQFVAVDREGCALVAEQLLELGMKLEEFAVIYTPNAKKDEEPLRRWYADAQWKRPHGRAADAEEVEVDEDSDIDIGEVRARKKFIEAFKDPDDPLKLLIVTDMLLTGFDAPVEQVMFLDKPLKGAKLLQAIMRTNRPYVEKDKDRGIIVDYWGVFDRLEACGVRKLGSACKSAPLKDGSEFWHPTRSNLAYPFCTREHRKPTRSLRQNTCKSCEADARIRTADPFITSDQVEVGISLQIWPLR